MWRSGSLRDRIAVVTALLTAVCMSSALLVSRGTHMLMPGPLASAHSTIEACSTCHTRSGTGKLGWLNGLVSGDPHEDSKACLTCHKMADTTAFNAHGVATDVLKESTERLVGIAVKMPRPMTAHAQGMAFPMGDRSTGDLACATCHHEHQGDRRDLTKISNEQCRSCHVVQFDAFDSGHPSFDAYPFKQRTRIIFDHAGHFGKHFPEVEKKNPTRSIPATCATCHEGRGATQVMAVLPFEKTCAKCHQDQIAGKERASGPKGIPFLSVPGLDLQTLKKKNVAIGEWPDASDAPLTPFMKVMIGWTDRGRSLIKSVEGVNLQDLTQATDEQIKAVAALAWEIKGLYSTLIKEKVSEALANLSAPDGTKLSSALAADLTAALPRDVVSSAQRQWLPQLGKELDDRAAASTRPAGGAGTTSKPQAPPEPSKAGKPGPQTMWRGSPLLTYVVSAEPESGEAQQDPEQSGSPITKRWTLPSGTPRSIDATRTKETGEREEPADQDLGTSDAIKSTNAPAEPAPAAKKPGVGEAASPPQNAPPQTGEQTDDLLTPTESELRAMKDGKGAPDATTSPKATENAAARPAQTGNAPTSEAAKAATAAPASPPSLEPVDQLDGTMDAESWAENGGWYRQDYTIFYRPTGHKDKFITSWLIFTGAYAPRGDTTPAAAVFDALTDKDAQGSCTKCHSVDDVAGRGRAVHFSPQSAAMKAGEFTRFKHQPHFGIMDQRGCLTCHALAKDRPYLKTYEQGNPKVFASNFEEVKKDLCQTCHTREKARQDCLTCHVYHVEPVSTPTISTKVPPR